MAAWCATNWFGAAPTKIITAMTIGPFQQTAILSQCKTYIDFYSQKTHTHTHTHTHIDFQEVSETKSYRFREVNH